MKLARNDTDGNTEVIRKETRIPILLFYLSSFFFESCASYTGEIR